MTVKRLRYTPPEAVGEGEATNHPIVAPGPLLLIFSRSLSYYILITNLVKLEFYTHVFMIEFWSHHVVIQPPDGLGV
jgi:hypothetical protein